MDAVTPVLSHAEFAKSHDNCSGLIGTLILKLGTFDVGNCPQALTDKIKTKDS